MMTKGMKSYIKKFITEECDDIIVDILASKLDVSIVRDGDVISFSVKFADNIIAEDKIDIK